MSLAPGRGRSPCRRLRRRRRHHALVCVALVTATSCRSTPSRPVTAGEPPSAYRITYRVEGDGRVTSQRLTVVRPFASHVEVFAGDALLNERISALGRLATRSAGGEWALLEVPPAPAASDLRPDVMVAAAERRGLVERRGTRTVAGRGCQVYRTAAVVAAGLLAEPDGAGADDIVEFCVDGAGLLLEERSAGQRRTATAVETTGVEVPPLPDVASLAPAQGGGRTTAADAGEPLPFAEPWMLPHPPSGFEAVGRFAVVPPASSGLALIAEVWQRGPDLLIVDQGAAAGPAPFDEGRPTDRVAVGALGEGELVYDLRATEVRVLLGDGGFLRVVATRPPDEVLGIARTLVPAGARAGEAVL